MNTQVMERTDPRDAIDAFAKAEPMERNGGALPSVRELAGAADRVIGAQQVAVYRDESRVLGKLKAFAAAAGTEWYYRFPVKNNRTQQTDWIEGPSIKLANDLARLYGNCETDVRVLDLGDSWLFYARFTDFETGFSLTRPFQQYKAASKMGGSDDARRKDIAFQIGASKAIRNVVVNALQTFADFAFEEAKGALVEKIGKDLPQWRTKIAGRIGEIGIDIKRVEAVLGRVSADWLAPDMARIVAMMKSIQDGMATLDETFPPIDTAKAEPAKQQATTIEKFADEQKPAADAERPAQIGPPEAMELGRKARDDNKALRAVPGEWRTEETAPLAAAWESGWKARDEEITAAAKEGKSTKK